MSDEPYMLPTTPPIMDAAKARDLARAYKGLADHLTDLGVTGEAARNLRSSQWWMAYSIALAQTKEG
jgi:hypothetical protein